MTVELISVGTELLLGNIVNTSANYLSVQCANLGFSLYHQVTVGDNEVRLAEAIKTAMQRADIIILTGGLGPTTDDITKETLAKVLGRDLIMDEHSKERILSYFKRIYSDSLSKEMPDGLAVITENNWKQALKIKDSIVVDNHNGTAPGYIVEDNKKVFILLPGPPAEMIPMFENDMIPYLKKYQDKVLLSKMVKICGIGESKAETMIMDLIAAQDNPTIAPYAKSGEVHFRVTAKSESIEEASALIEPVINELKARFGNNIYTTSEDVNLEDAVIDLLMRHKLTLSTAESCTGGLLAGRLVNVSGASDVFMEGFITYSNKAKMKYLNVSPDTLDKFGAVSEETAREMAEGCAKVSGCDVSVAVTGIAGPTGGTPDKPVGLVYISCHAGEKTYVIKRQFKGSRQKIREQSVVAALDLVRRCVSENYDS